MTDYTEEQIREFARRDFVIGVRAGMPSGGDELSIFSQQISGATIDYSGDGAMLQGSITKTLVRIPHTGKLIGLIESVNDDGSYRIKIYGDETINFNSMKAIFEQRRLRAICEYVDGKYNFNSIADYVTSDITSSPTTVWAYGYGGDVTGSSYGNISVDQSYNYTPIWVNFDKSYGSYDSFFLFNYTNIPMNNVNSITFNKTGYEMGIPTFVTAMYPKEYALAYGGGLEVYDYIAGNIWELLQDFASELTGALFGRDYKEGTQKMTELYNSLNNGGVTHAQYACIWKPYNLILTENPNAINQYLLADVIPSDAIIFPWDPDVFPQYIPSGGNPPTSGGDDPGEGGDPKRHMEPTPEPIPDYTPQRLTNNNLYWLTASQLESFINWFWTDAGDILDTGNLWARVQGLFNDLASAIINIRYYPVQTIFLGETSNTNHIILGNIQYEPEGASFTIFNKDNPTKRTVGSIAIKEVINEISTVSGFHNYTPYANLSLYLPFHGFIDLDNDLFMEQTLTVKCLYDILTGTIQYDIFCNETLVTSIPCKMAVDIPITLQSKGDRDSAIFQNVGSVIGNIASSVAGVATGNPIGLTMGISNLGQAVGNVGSQSAPMRVIGSEQETGAFFAPNKCAIYIRRPVYNRPQLYKSRVGYPCNKSYSIGHDDITGYLQVYNPVINFKGNANNEGNTMRPTQEEIEEIYSMLREGVIK